MFRQSQHNCQPIGVKVGKEEKMKDNFFVIDARSRDLVMFTASGSILNGGIILRRGIELGHLASMQHQVKLTGDWLLFMGQYQARSSAGFTELVAPFAKNCTSVLGGTGFGRDVTDQTGKNLRIGDNLRLFKYSVPSTLFDLSGKGEMFVRYSAQGNLNSNTSEAAYAIAAKFFSDNGVTALFEGQSNYVQSWIFEGLGLPLFDKLGSAGIPNEWQTLMKAMEKKKGVIETEVS